MEVRQLLADSFKFISECFALIFHRRNVIIVSERKVKHMPVSGYVQAFFVFFALIGFCWSVYSTGQFLTTQSALKEQSEALKSFVGNRFSNSVLFGNTKEGFGGSITTKSALASVENMDLYSRIAELETKLQHAEQSKKIFVDQVRQKTVSNISSMEELIEQTGLDLTSLKKQVSVTQPDALPTAKKPFDLQGGPYVPELTGTLSSNEREVINKLDELQTLNTIIGNLPVRKPIHGYQEMSQFGRRIDPFTGRLAFHSGLDMAGPAGSKIYATADGTVSFTGRQGAYGNMVDVDHGFKISTRYAHLSQILVEKGQRVKKGQVIAIQGSTGRSTGAHLHYEVRYNDQPMNPRNFLKAGMYVPKS